MDSLTSLILGIIIGGIVSSLIANKYYTKQLGNPENEVKVHGTINENIEQCWETITSPENMKFFTRADCERFCDLANEIGPGTIIKSKYMHTDTTFNQYVCEWNPPSVFAWGKNQEDWHHFIELKKSGDKTNIFLKRCFERENREWYLMLIDKMFNANGISEIESEGINETRKTLRYIIGLCERP